MLKLEYFSTSQLFYNTYLYKISFYNQLNTIFRTEFQKNGALGYAEKKIDTFTECYRAGVSMQIPIWRTYRDIDDETYLDARHVYNCLLGKHGYRVRVESYGGMSIFSNDLNLIEKIGKGLRSKKIAIYQPDNSIISELLKSPNIIVSSKPVEWSIKVTLGGRFRDYSGFASWCENNRDKIKIGEVALDSIKNGHYVSNYYFYLKNDKMLNLISIMIGDNIRRIDHIIFKDNIG